MDIISTAILLFLIMDPLGNMPIFLSILKTIPKERRKKVLVRELVFSLIIMLIFLFIGGPTMDVMGLRQESVSIGGGIVLMLIALKMIFPPKDGGIMGSNPDGEPFIVPLAIPLIAGPSILAALLVMTHQFPGHPLQWVTAVLLAWGTTSLIMLSSGILMRMLGKRGLIAMERLMGMILVMLSVQLFLDGVIAYINA